MSPTYQVHYVEHGSYEIAADSESAARQDFVDNGPRNQTEITGQRVEHIEHLGEESPDGHRQRHAVMIVREQALGLDPLCPTAAGGMRYMIIQRSGPRRWLEFGDDPVTLYRQTDAQEGWKPERVYDLDTGAPVTVHRRYEVEQDNHEPDRAWFAIVGVGATSGRPHGVFETLEAAQEEVRVFDEQHDFSLAATDTRIYTYRSRAAANKANISDNVGTYGRIG